LRLVNDPELGARLARGALVRLRERHSYERFSRQLSGILAHDREKRAPVFEKDHAPAKP
jgi:hypothetical protein